MMLSQKGGENMDRAKVGRRIRALREDRGQSMAYVARKLGLPYNSYYSYEYGLRLPSEKNKEKIANYYGCDVEDIFFEEGNHTEQ